MLLLVVDSTKEGMPLRSLFSDFVAIRTGVQVHGCSLWIKPYDPTPLVVFNPNHADIAVGEIIQAPSMERLLDFINMQSCLYPYSQRMILEATGTSVSFFYSQKFIPDLSTEYAKLESGNFSKEEHDALWNDVITDSVWLE